MVWKIHNTETKSFQKPKEIHVEDTNEKQYISTSTKTYLVNNKSDGKLEGEKLNFKAFQPIKAQTSAHEYQEVSTYDETFSGSGKMSESQYKISLNEKLLKNYTNNKKIENTISQLKVATNFSEVKYRSF